MRLQSSRYGSVVVAATPPSAIATPPSAILTCKGTLRQVFYLSEAPHGLGGR